MATKMNQYRLDLLSMERADEIARDRAIDATSTEHAEQRRYLQELGYMMIVPLLVKQNELLEQLVATTIISEATK